MSDYPGLVTKWRKKAKRLSTVIAFGEDRTLEKCADELAEEIAKHQVSADWIRKAAREIVGDEYGISYESVEEQFAYKVRNVAEVIARNVQPSPTNSFLCAARHSDTGANDPQDCSWPFCGCDEYADKVIEAIKESGFTLMKYEDLLRLTSQAEARPVQQPATEPEEFSGRCRTCGNTGIVYTANGSEPCSKCALALRDVPQGPDDREIVAEWRSCLCAAWASGHRAVMTMLLERGPSYPARSVPVGPTKEEK